MATPIVPLDYPKVNVFHIKNSIFLSIIDSIEQYLGEVTAHKKPSEIELTLYEASEVLDLICLQQKEKKEIPDDYIAKIWVGRRIIRFLDKRFEVPINLQELHDSLYHAIVSVERRVHGNDYVKEKTNNAIKEIVKELGLLEEVF